jgi:multidrug resistance protein MdtO
MRTSGLMVDLLAPSPERLARSLEISITCMLVVLISMTFQIPEPAISTYLIFFAAKEDAGLNIVMSIVLIVVITIVVALAFGLALLSLNSPEGRILIIAAVAFVAFFLGTASKLEPLASTIGLIIAYALDLLGSSPFGEVTTRGLLYAWLFVAMPMAVFLAYNVFFGRRPDILISRTVAERLRTASRVLRRRNDTTMEQLEKSLRGGNAELLKMLKMVGLLRFRSSDSIGRLRALIALSHNLAMTVSAAESEHDAAMTVTDVVPRIEKLATAVEWMRPLSHVPSHEHGSERPAAVRGLEDQIIGLVESIENVVIGDIVPDVGPHAVPIEHKPGFFAADAFKNPDHVRYAAKGATAVMVCYLTFTLLDWPGIHTAMLTCFIVGLTTIGETLQKLTLRIVGCCAGAALGTLSIVYILPHTTSISSLLLLIGLVTLPTAWIAVGKPTVSYIGFQAAFALYLCILQGDAPKFDLTIARDRTIGILFGNIVIYLIFTRVFPVSMLGRLRLQLADSVSRGSALLKTLADFRPQAAAAWQAADIQFSLEKVEASAATFTYETERSRNARDQRDAIDKCVDELRALIANLCKIAAYPPTKDDSPRVSIRDICTQFGDRLEAVAEAVVAGRNPQAVSDRSAELLGLTAQLRNVDIAWSGPAAKFEALQQRIDGLVAALSEYLRVQHAEAEVHA